MKGSALDWWRKGYTPLPIRFRDKRPAVKWSQYVGNRPGWGVVGRWWNTLRNVGVLLEGGLTVLDFDEEGYYERWVEKTGIETFTVQTARGYHAYVKLQYPMPITVKMDGGDVKSTGFIVTAPSIHSEGIRYRVVSEAPVWGAVMVDDCGVNLTKVEVPKIKTARRVVNGEGVIARIKMRVGILDVLSERMDRAYSNGNGKISMTCPLHNDSNPSMVIDVERDRCRCFSPGCVAHPHYMDAIDMYAALRGMKNDEAIVAMAARYGI